VTGFAALPPHRRTTSLCGGVGDAGGLLLGVALVAELLVQFGVLQGRVLLTGHRVGPSSWRSEPYSTASPPLRVRATLPRDKGETSQPAKISANLQTRRCTQRFRRS